MAKNYESRRQTVSGKKLSCPVCNHDMFWSRETLMNTPGMTFFGLEWANKKATNYICDKCGYVFWFFNK
jgi:C4-type Zn-finger protein